MKIIRLLPYIILVSLFSSFSFAENKDNCSQMGADTGVKIYKKIKCKMEQSKDESIGNKIKNIFKKKN